MILISGIKIMRGFSMAEAASLHAARARGRAGGTMSAIAIEADAQERKLIEALGIFPGCEVRVLVSGAGPVLLAVGETRKALKKTLARKVIVACLLFSCTIEA